MGLEREIDNTNVASTSLAHVAAQVPELAFEPGRFHRPDLVDMQLIDASNDLEAITAFLRSDTANGSPATQRRYAGELYRFGVWAYLIRQRTISDMGTEDFSAYRQWLLAPPENQVEYEERALFRRRRIKGEDGKTVLGYGVSAQSAGNAMAIVGSLYSWLHNNRYLYCDPMRGDKSVRRQPKKKRASKALSGQAIRSLLLCIERDAGDTEVSVRKAARARLMVIWGALLGLRRFEWAMVRMHSLVWRQQSGAYWWEGIQKGGGEHERPVPRLLIKELKRYCDAMGTVFAPGSGPRGNDPIFVRVDNVAIGVGEDTIYNELKHYFEKTARLIELGELPGSASDAEMLRKATPHWLRHTMITASSRAGNAGALSRDLAGHSHESTTNTYTGSADIELVEGAERVARLLETSI